MKELANKWRSLKFNDCGLIAKSLCHYAKLPAYKSVIPFTISLASSSARLALASNTNDIYNLLKSAVFVLIIALKVTHEHHISVLNK